MAYSDIQNKVGQIQMANRVLLAQKMDPNKTPETDLEGFQEQGGYAPEEEVDVQPVDGPNKVNWRKQLYPDYKANRRGIRRKKGRFEGLNDDQIRAKIAEEDAQRAKEAEEERLDQDPELNKQREDLRQGDYLQDPENPFNLNTLLQIGGAAGSMIPFMGGNILKMLIGGPNAMAMNFEDAGFGEGGFVSTDKPNIYINSGAEAYILEPNGNFKFDGMYDPKRHGKTFPGLGLVQRNDDMKIAKLPHSPPVEKIVLPNGKLMDSPLRFKTDQERIKFMEDFSRGYGRYS